MQVPFPIEGYEEGLARWSTTVDAIMACSDSDGIWVYQAYCDEIADYAVKNQRFLGCPSYSATRMTWIKPGFLWMQFRSGWCTKVNQTRCLAIKLPHAVFQKYLKIGVSTKKTCQEGQPDVRIQYDPDHDPSGGKCDRRAIQIGLRGKTLHELASGDDLLQICDVTHFVVSQRQLASESETWGQLKVPIETVYVNN